MSGRARSSSSASPVASINRSNGYREEPELDYFLQFVTEIGHVTLDIEPQTRTVWSAAPGSPVKVRGSGKERTRSEAGEARMMNIARALPHPPLLTSYWFEST